MRIRRDERGAIAVMTAAAMLMLVSTVALAVDSGHTTFRKRTLQGFADLIALDAARAVGDRYDPMVSALTYAQQLAQESATRNGFDWTDTAHGNGMTVQIGVLEWNTNTFTTPPPGGDAAANAVRVVLTGRVDHGFMPGSTGLDAQAIAANDEQAGLSVGSSLVRFNSANTVFNPILGQMLGVSFDVAGYNALLGASVALGDVWANLGLGSSSQVMNGQVNAADAFTAMASALTAQGDAASVSAANALTAQKASVRSGATFHFGDIMDSDAFSPSEVAGTRVNVLQLMSLIASAANGSNLVSVTLPVTIPGVTTTTMKMGVIEPAKLAFGPARTDAGGSWVTRARTAQMRIQLTLTLTQKLSVAGQNLTVTLPVYVEAGGADGDLTSIDCRVPFDQSPVGVHVQTRTSKASVGQVSDAVLTGGTVTVNPGTLVSQPTLLTATGSASLTVAASSSDLTFTGPFDQPPSPSTVTPKTRPRQTVGATTPDLDSLATNLTVTVTPAAGAGLLVNATSVAATLKTMLTPIIQQVDTGIVSALMDTPLGFYFGGADVTNVSLNCHVRRLGA